MSILLFTINNCVDMVFIFFIKNLKTVLNYNIGSYYNTDFSDFKEFIVEFY